MDAALSLAAEHDLAGRHDDAINALARATQAGDVDAMHELGKRLGIGDRAPWLPQDGAGFLLDAAKAGHADAALRLATLTALGAYVEQNWGEALGLLVFAAERSALHECVVERRARLAHGARRLTAQGQGKVDRVAVHSQPRRARRARREPGLALSLASRHLRGVVAALAIAAGGFSAAQQQVPFANGIPVAPEMPIPPLPDRPVEYATAEGMRIRVSVVARGIAHPWSIAFLPDDVWLVTQTHGGLRVVRDGVLDPNPVAGAPEVKPLRRSGLLEVTLHPRFGDNRYVYLTYHKGLPDDKGALALARGRWNGSALEDVRDLFVTQPDSGTVSRMIFGPDGKIYLSTAGGDAQDPTTHAGKILRLNEDGSVPRDNPFASRAGFLPEIYTLGHRTTLGLAVHPSTGQIWQSENGPNGGDEINILVPGGNYGWPRVSLGRTYQGPWHAQKFQQEGFIDPIVYWMPSIAVSGLAFYTGDRLAKWKGDVFVGGLRTGEIIGTGQIQRILFNEGMEELRREALLTDWRHRMRDIRQGPDGLLYVLVDDEDGAILRIEPAP